MASGSALGGGKLPIMAVELALLKTSFSYVSLCIFLSQPYTLKYGIIKINEHTFWWFLAQH